MKEWGFLPADAMLRIAPVAGLILKLDAARKFSVKILVFPTHVGMNQ
jgi:hypothetical protein